MGKLQKILTSSLAGLFVAVAMIGIRPMSLLWYYQPEAPKELMRK